MTGVLKSWVTETEEVSECVLVGLLSRETVIFLPLPLAILARTPFASSSLPCTSNHRGDSGIHLQAEETQHQNRRGRMETSSPPQPQKHESTDRNKHTQNPPVSNEVRQHWQETDPNRKETLSQNSHQTSLSSPDTLQEKTVVHDNHCLTHESKQEPEQDKHGEPGAHSVAEPCEGTAQEVEEQDLLSPVHIGQGTEDPRSDGEAEEVGRLSDVRVG